MLWLLVCACLLQSLPPQVPSRDAPAPRTGSATIRGRVTDAETGQPVVRVVVQVSSEALIGNPIAATTGDDGRYVLTSVPAGRLAVIAQMAPYRTQYLPQAYGQSTPIDPVRGAVSRDAYLTIADGETREGIDIRLTRSLGISGRVVNGRRADVERRCSGRGSIGLVRWRWTVAANRRSRRVPALRVDAWAVPRLRGTGTVRPAIGRANR